MYHKLQVKVLTENLTVDECTYYLKYRSSPHWLSHNVSLYCLKLRNHVIVAIHVSDI